ncbi:MAG: hypothetical protein KBS98_03005 [Flavobacterium sp.]|nr:hypothetical protein [Candidatus Neoflavobacterium equi]
MKKFLFLALWSAFAQAQIGSAVHCGFDFTSYLVVKVHEEGKGEYIPNLKIAVVDAQGNTLVNLQNVYSWVKANEPMVFVENYKIDDQRWFFPYEQSVYLLSVTNTFPVGNFFLKVEDVDGAAHGGTYETVVQELHSFNMYVLCSSEREKAVQFGRRISNQPIEVVLKKA